MSCFVDGCTRPAEVRGMCDTHYEYARRHGHIAVEAQRREALIEDVEWMITTGETNAEAIARRLGMRPTTIERRLQRHGRNDLIRKITGLGTNALKAGAW